MDIYLFWLGLPLIAGLGVATLAMPVLRRLDRMGVPLPAFGLLGLPPIIMVIASAGIYLASPVFLSHVEVQIAEVAAGAIGPYAGDGTYSLAYGPLTYGLIRLGARLVPGIAGLKLAGMMGVAGGVLLTAAAAWVVTRRWSVAAAAGGLAAAVVVNHPSHMFFAASADPLLVGAAGLAAVIAALGAAWPERRLAAAVLLGVVLGAMSHLKVHGALYGVALVFLLAEAGDRRRVFGAVAAGAAAAVVAGLVIPSIPLDGYAAILIRAAGHPMKMDFFLVSASLGLGLVAPACILVALDRKSAGILPCVILALSAVLVTRVASKLGAGPHHLIPFAPAAILLAVWVGRRHPVPAIAMAMGIGVALTPAVAYRGWDAWRLVNGLTPVARASAVAVEQALGLLPGMRVGMGYGGRRTYVATFVRPLLTAGGQPLLVDPVALMDDQLLDPAASDQAASAVAACYYDAWLVPRGEEPFSLTSFYDGSPVFGGTFRRAFFETHQPVGRIGPFDLWRCVRGHR